MIKALIVEDDETFRLTLKRLLDSRFPTMSLDEAEDAEKALQKIETIAPHLVFVDIKLPGLNGLELTRRIKDLDPKIVIVVMTSYDIPEYRNAAYECGANHFASKHSSSASEILCMVESILSDLSAPAVC